MNEKRLLNPLDLPKSLWDAKSQTLSLPHPLARSYELIIDRNNLRNLAKSRDSKDPPVGGLSQEEADKHFAQAFDGSVARAQLAMLDPKMKMTAASNACVSNFSGNKLILTDAPCGAGAATLAFLANIAELRANNLIPRHPLDVFWIGAELSKPARIYAQALLDELKTSLEEQAIFVTSEFIEWDVTNSLSNTDLIKIMTVQGKDYKKRLLIVANFNAFLQKARKRKAAKPQLSELFRHASGEHSTVLWIEPKMNSATQAGGLFPWLRDQIRKTWRSFSKDKINRDDPIPTSDARFNLPLNSGGTARVGLAVLPIELAREK